MKNHRNSLFLLSIFLILFLFSLTFVTHSPANAEGENPYPPAEPVKLIFIHHSVGENWLTDGNGNLGQTLNANNYFVSDTNYGWGPDSIGDATDYPNWLDWFIWEEHRTFRHSMHVTSKTQLLKIIQKFRTEPLGLLQPLQFGCAKSKLAEITDHLRQPGRQEKASFGRQLAYKKLKNGDVGHTGLEISLHHVELIKVRKQGTVTSANG